MDSLKLSIEDIIQFTIIGSQTVNCINQNENNLIVHFLKKTNTMEARIYSALLSFIGTSFNLQQDIHDPMSFP